MPLSRSLHPLTPRTLLQAIWVMDFVLFSTLGLIKLSILFFYKKIFAISRRFRIVAWIAIAIIVMWTVGFSFAYMCISIPSLYHWDV